ncbi:MAG: MFS transporter [Saccharopolyspora sp.]|uniref:CynX/NimT family MFS transporter n=1 Tax=Saccharopolyspora sp. TaxID=33915 RepID=UPI0026011FB4|nr:MFS transporter [Saccharopolyspora sp.]MBQ6643090.1 MFS transporter [Saccharopolyspora sp.]
MTTQLRERFAIGTSVLVVLVALALRPPVTAVAPVLDRILGDLGLSSTFGGVLTTLPPVCLGVFAFVAPRLRQRFGDERVLVGCLVVLLAGNLLRAAGSVWALVGGTVVVGAGIAVANVALPGVIKRDFPSRVPGVTALYTMCLTLGGALAASVVVPLGGALGSAWRLPLGLLAVPVLLALLLCAFALRGAVSRQRVVRPGLLWRNRLAWQVTGFMGAQSLMAYVVFGWLPSMAQSQGMSAEAAGALLGVQAAVQALGSLTVPVLCRRLRDQRWVAMALGVLTALGFAGVLLAPGTAVVWTATVVLGLAQGAAFGLALTLFGLRAPDSDTTVALSGMAQGAGYLIAATGPLLIGVLHGATGGWTVPLVLLMVCCAGETVLGAVAGRDRQVPSVIGAQHAGDGTTAP